MRHEIAKNPPWCLAVPFLSGHSETMLKILDLEEILKGLTKISLKPPNPVQQ